MSSENAENAKKAIKKINTLPLEYKSKPEQDVCLICQEEFSDGNRITMCAQCRVFLHYRCQLEWLFFYNTIWTRDCCHCKRSWEADYSTIQIVKGNEDETKSE